MRAQDIDKQVDKWINFIYREINEFLNSLDIKEKTKILKNYEKIINNLEKVKQFTISTKKKEEEDLA